MRWWLVIVLCLLLQISLQADKKKGAAGKGEESKGSRGSTRQATTRKTTRPPSRSFFSLVSQFVRETVADANRAAANISLIINETFPSSFPSTGNTTEAPSEMLSLQNVTDVLNKNYRSLRRLFSREFSNAIRDSRKNIERYRKEFRSALRPYFFPSATSSPAPNTTSS